MNITALGIDLAKNVFQLHGVDARGKAILKKKISRDNLSEFIANLAKCTIFMEACGASNYWGRKFAEFGHEVKLISPQYVKPFVKTNKNDANDAEAIVEAGSRPSMRFVDVKTEYQQDIQSTHRIRERLVNNRTALVNQIRGLLGEYGIVVPQGIHKLRDKLPKILESNGLSGLMQANIEELYEEFKLADERIEKFNKKIDAIFESDETCKKVEKIPGIGKLGATMLVAIIGKGSAFKNGRHFAAFCGLVPRQHSSGGKAQLFGISKRGDVYLRKLLTHGGRAVLRCVSGKKDTESVWLDQLAQRAGANRASVAWANKIARKAWAIIHSGADYVEDHIPERKELAPKNANLQKRKVSSNKCKSA